MWTVRGAERVVHVHVSVLCEGFGHFFALGRILGRFFFVKPGVLQHQNAAPWNGFHHCFGFRSHARGRELHLFAKQLGQVRGHRRHFMFSLDVFLFVKRLAVFFGLVLRLLHVLFRIAEVGHQHKAGAPLVEHVLDGWERGFDPRVVLNDPVFERDIEVDAHENAFPGDIDIADGLFRDCHGFLLTR